MAIVIQFDSGNERTWNIGEKIPVSFTEVKAINNILVDGDELNLLIRNFVNLPRLSSLSTKRTTRYFGESAKFIIGNL